MSFEMLPDELLPAVFSHLSPGVMLKLSLVCKRFAQGCELGLAQVCASNKWVMPRKPRGQAAKQHHFPVRAMYRRHACISCGEPGEFPVRSGHTAGTKQAPIVFLVCKRCARLPAVQGRLVDVNLYVDLMSISGTKRLLDKPSKNKSPQKRKA